MSAIHPLARMAENGHNLLGWIDWMFAHAGTSGKLKAARAVEKVKG